MFTDADHNDDAVLQFAEFETFVNNVRKASTTLKVIADSETIQSVFEKVDIDNDGVL